MMRKEHLGNIRGRAGLNHKLDQGPSSPNIDRHGAHPAALAAAIQVARYRKPSHSR
jgi:hypothetical protein